MGYIPPQNLMHTYAVQNPHIRQWMWRRG